YAAFLDAAPGGGPGISASVANGYDLDSPYNSDLPYDIEQFAFFGEVSYDVTDMLTMTVGGRYYDFDETRTITQGGFFSSGFDGEVDNTSSDGFTPRVLASLALSDTLTV